jgi:hypothetical protein
MNCSSGMAFRYPLRLSITTTRAPPFSMASRTLPENSPGERSAGSICSKRSRPSSTCGARSMPIPAARLSSTCRVSSKLTISVLDTVRMLILHAQRCSGKAWSRTRERKRWTCMASSAWAVRFARKRRSAYSAARKVPCGGGPTASLFRRVRRGIPVGPNVRPAATQLTRPLRALAHGHGGANCEATSMEPIA